MLADIVVYHPFLTHCLDFAATTAGRDKVFRTIQYIARFYAWYLARVGKRLDLSTRYSSLKKQLGLVRKLLRVGKNVEHFKAAAMAFDNGSTDSFIRYTTVGRQLSYFIYLTADSSTIFDALGVRYWAAARRLEEQAHRFWVLGLAFSIACQSYTLARIRQRESSIDRDDGDGALESKRLAMSEDGLPPSIDLRLTKLTMSIVSRNKTNSQLQLLTDMCDIVLPMSALGWLTLNDGVVGVAGILSSAVGTYTQWSKTA
jgi:peroxin-11B